MERKPFEKPRISLSPSKKRLPKRKIKWERFRCPNKFWFKNGRTTVWETKDFLKPAEKEASKTENKVGTLKVSKQVLVLKLKESLLGNQELP